MQDLALQMADQHARSHVSFPYPPPSHIPLPPGVAEAADDWDALDADDLAAIACPGLPPSPERATFDFDDCRDMAAGEECEADCLDENDDGVVVATCNADGTFAINGSCTPGSPDRAGEGATTCF